MNKRQVNRKEMQDTVISYLDQNPTKWSSIPKAVQAKTNLTVINDQISNAQSAQLAAKVYVGPTKKLLKGIIAEKADILNDVVEAYASINDFPELENRMAISTNRFIKMRNEDFIAGVKEVITETEKVKDELITDYGLTEAQVEDLKTDFNRYMELKGLPRAYDVAMRQATADLESLFEQASDILTNQLDKVMKIFKRRDPGFYNGYIAARVIVDD